MAQVPNRHKGALGEGDPNLAPINDPTVVLVFQRAVDDKGSITETEGDKAQKERLKVSAALVNCNLSVVSSKSLDEKYVFFRVSIPMSTMKTEAERRKLPVRFSQKAAPPLGAWVPFFAKGNTPSTMEPSSDGKGPFSSLQMCHVIEEMLTLKKEFGGAGLDFEKLKKDFGFVEYFYLHHESMRYILEENWGMQWMAKQPLKEVRTYFGDKIGLYFAFLGFYTSSLWIPAIVGVLMTLTQVYSYTTIGSIDNPFVPLYCSFMSLWGVIFCNNWKKIENRLQYEWNTRNFEKDEKPRAAFLLATNRTEVRKGLIDEKDERFYKPMFRLLWIGLSATVCFAFIAVVLYVTCFIFILKEFTFPKMFGPSSAIIGGALNAISIMVMNSLYELVEHRLTEQELWRTDTEHEDSLIAKDFAFKFVNAYFSLFFTAFVMGNFEVLGHRLSCPAEGCANTVMETLGIVFISQMFVQQLLEIGVPRFQKWYEAYRAAKEMAEKGQVPKTAPREEIEFRYPEYPGVFSDYQEMVIQFGYVTMFAAAFPLTATLALINNIIEIRVDAVKLLTTHRRPSYNSTQDIGSWQHVMDIICTVSIMTNVPAPSPPPFTHFLDSWPQVAYVGFTSDGLGFYFSHLTMNTRLWIVLIAEHVLLLIKVRIASPRAIFHFHSPTQCRFCSHLCCPPSTRTSCSSTSIQCNPHQSPRVSVLIVTS